VTIARRRINPFSSMTASLPAVPETSHRPGGIPVAVGDVPAPESIAPVGRLRRCTFRRIDSLEALPGHATTPAYEVMCLYGGLQTPMALGDVDAARPFCEACTATGIFRPDEA
jgi:hypothetical protein